MTDDIRLSDSNVPDFRADASRGDPTPRQTVRSSGGSRRTDIAGARALEPVIQSALGIVRESAGLLYHIAGFVVALVSDPQSSPVAPEGANVIPLPSSKCRATGQRSTRNRS